MRNLDNFWQAVESPKSSISMDYICVKTTYIPSPKILFADFSNIIFNWPVVWKMTWRIWQIFSRALNIGILMGSFNPNLKKCELKIHRGVIYHDNEELRKFEEEPTCHFKDDIRNLTNIDPSTWKSQNFSF